MKWKEVRFEAEQIMADTERFESPCLEDLLPAIDQFNTVAVLLSVAIDQLTSVDNNFPEHNPAKCLKKILDNGITECLKQGYVLTRAHKNLLQYG